MKHTFPIYKYRTWNNEFHKKLLHNNELLFALPREINDPFDFKISIDISQLDTDEKIESFVNDIIEDATGMFPDFSNPILEIERKNIIHRLKNSPLDFQTEYELNEFAHMDAHIGIISFSKRWDSILMWSHYANNHTGFCVGFDLAKMNDSNLFNAHGPVSYKESFPKINPLLRNSIQSIIARSHTKAQDWKYEEEYRFVNIFEDADLLPENRIVKFDDAIIEEVILGLEISSSNKEEITTVCRNKKIPVYQINKKIGQFGLDKVLVKI